jgi:hypothetical protein
MSRDARRSGRAAFTEAENGRTSTCTIFAAESFMLINFVAGATLKS